MSEPNKDYVVYGMKVKCSEGSMENFLSTDKGHGVTYQGQPLMNANDHTKQVNLTHFGDCHSKKVYEDAKKQADEKYKADADDGFFAKAGKWIAKTVTKAVINVQEHLMFHKCELDTPLPWMFCNGEHMIDGAPALTIESQCACRMGGIITVVPMEAAEEEVISAEEEITVTQKTVVLEPLMAPIQTNETYTISKDKGGKASADSVLPKGGIELILSTNPEEADRELERIHRMVCMPVIEKYVTEGKLNLINNNWGKNMRTFKSLYGEDVLEQMRELMYQYEITDETSILMFLSTIGVETGHGTNIGEIKNGLSDEDFDKNRDEKGVPIIDSSIGIGLIQVSKESQQNFIRDFYLTRGDEEERARIEEYFNVTEEMLKKPESAEMLENAAGFIYEYYPIEASMWYWGQAVEKCAVFDDTGEQTNMSINDYIAYYANNDANMDNVFMAVQYNLNGRRKFSKEDVDDICKSKESVWESNQTQVIINGDKSDIPNGWTDRKSDWDNAKKLPAE